MQRLSLTATRRAVSSSLGGNPSAKANDATCVQVVTNAGNVVVVVVGGNDAITTCGVSVGACAFPGLKTNKTPIIRAIAPVVILWVIILLLPFGRGFPMFR